MDNTLTDLNYRIINTPLWLLSGTKRNICRSRWCFYQTGDFYIFWHTRTGFMGSTAKGNYSVEGNNLKIVDAVENQILTMTDDDYLDGGGFVGKYCKE